MRNTEGDARFEPGTSVLAVCCTNPLDTYYTINTAFLILIPTGVGLYMANKTLEACCKKMSEVNCLKVISIPHNILCFMHFFYTTLNYDAMRQQKVTSNNEIDF